MEIKEFVIYLTKEIQKLVKPELGKLSSRKTSGQAVGGDTTFIIDEQAEKLLDRLLEKEGNIAFYSEDKGFVTYGKPEYVLIVDPIDGTRPAVAGLESCCVSIAAAHNKSDPKMKDVFFGCVQEIKNDTIFYAERGRGVKIFDRDEELEPVLSNQKNLKNLFWCIGFRGRPAKPLVAVLGALIDISSVDGGVFDLGSACFSTTRMITGQMDAYIDIGKRIIDEVSWVEDEFLNVGRGSVLNNNPYDVAASSLIAQEAGCVITDGYGNSIDEFPLLGSGPDYQFSLIGATNQELHHKVINAVDQGIKKLKKVDPAALQ